MVLKSTKNYCLVPLLFAFLISQCTAAEPVQSPYPLSAAQYLEQASTLVGSEKQNALLFAAGRMIFDGFWRQGSVILAQTQDLNADQQREKKVLTAKIDLFGDHVQEAIVQLTAIKEPGNLSVFHQIQFYELLAQAYRIKKNFRQSIFARIKLDSLLPDNASQQTNHRALWLTLINIPSAKLNNLATETKKKSEIAGWLQLALISRKYKDNAKSLFAAVDQWQTHFSDHPANLILPNPLDSIADKIVVQPKQIALLLPLSGVLAGPGNAIQAGFMAAYKSNDHEKKSVVKVYDTDQEDIIETYQKAINEGAEYVVGPLVKSQAATIAGIAHPVPTLLLNDVDGTLESNSYLFGLSPTNEAQQVALKAKNKGYQRALIIAPQNEWGNEVIKAFSTQWKENGGHVVDTFLYTNDTDMNKKMRDFLQIDQSQARLKQLREVLGQNLEMGISRRQDFDMIFLLAYPSKARQIMPMLKYYYAGDVPVFATSSVYGGSANALKDKDLEGVIFCDIPWVFSHQLENKNWPEQFNSYNRLYALGMDSYALANQLNQLILFPADGSKDSNGTLYLKPSQQVARVLEWGEFKAGLAHSLGETV